MFDLIGIGALNVDYIVTGSRLKKRHPEEFTELTSSFEYGSEKPDDQGMVSHFLELRKEQPDLFHTSLGGSTFNTIQALRRINSDLTLGYVGVAGETNVLGSDFVEELVDLNVDQQHVERAPEVSGACISYIDRGERSLLTSRGANSRLAEYLSVNGEEVSTYIADSRVVHVTSFLDETTPKELVRVLKAAKEKNPQLTLSVDPGYHWMKTLTDSVRDIVGLADVVFLNDSEFKLLGKALLGPTDQALVRAIDGAALADEEAEDKLDTDLAAKIVDSFGHQMLVLVKKYAKVKLFSNIFGEPPERRFLYDVLPADQIEDATGAGDVFAAGFLAGLLTPGLETGDGIELGLELARKKLQGPGTSTFGEFPEIVHSFITGLSPGATSSGAQALGTAYRLEAGPKVFIAHAGRTPALEIIESFLNALGADPVIAEDRPSEGRSVDAHVAFCIQRSDCAIVLGTRDGRIKGRPQLAPNVIDEAGQLRQAMPDRVIYLLEEGIADPPSNFREKVRVRFSESGMDAALTSIVRHLKAFGLL